MLSDDIANGISTVLEGVGKVFSGAWRGFVLFGIGALLVGAAVVALQCTMVGGPVELAIAMAGSILNFSSPAWVWATAGAFTGAALMGVASLIPGKAESYGKTETQAATPPVKIIEKTAEPQQNYAYEQGRGARMAEQGNNAQAAICRT